MPKKKIGFITTNRVLAQSLVAAIKHYPDLAFDSFLLLDGGQAVLDAEILNIDVAVIDVIEGATDETRTISALCGALRRVTPSCRLLLLLSQDDRAGRDMAIEAVKSKTADDFVFYDTSLDYLLAKLIAL